MFALPPFSRMLRSVMRNRLCVCALFLPQVVNTQRDKIYSERRKALLSKDLTAMMVEYAERTADDILEVRGPRCHN